MSGQQHLISGIYPKHGAYVKLNDSALQPHDGAMHTHDSNMTIKSYITY